MWLLQNPLDKKKQIFPPQSAFLPLDPTKIKSSLQNSSWIFTNTSMQFYDNMRLLDLKWLTLLSSGDTFLTRVAFRHKYIQPRFQFISSFMSLVLFTKSYTWLENEKHLSSIIKLFPQSLLLQIDIYWS